MKLFRKLRSLFRKEKLDAEMFAEMHAHVDLQAERHIAAGLNPDEARYAALRQFGNVAKVQEQCREQHGWAWWENWARDLRLAARSLARAPGFSLTVFLTLVLCIGPNTAVLSALYTLVLRPLPFPAPQQLVVIKNVGTKAGNIVNNSGLPQYLDYTAQAGHFQRFALFEAANTTIGEDSVPTRVLGYRVTAGFFDLLGAAPQAGRFFASDEETVGREHVLVLTHSFWLQQYQGDPRVIGREVRMGGEMFTIVGIAPPAIETMFMRVDFFRPFQHGPTDLNPERRFASRATLLGRMKPGVTAKDAQTQLATIEDRFLNGTASPAMKAAIARGGFRVTVESWRNDSLAMVRQPLWTLEAGAVLVLLIGCVNVANLMLARVNVKRSELAIRMALGAGWSALFRQMFCEMLLLAGLAALAGITTGWATLQLLNHSVVVMERFAPPIRIDDGIVVIVLLLIGGIALLVGSVPLVLLRRAGLRVGETRAASAGGGMRFLSSTLVVGQVALALILLVGAGLLIRSFANVMSVNPGFDAGHVVQGRIALSRNYDGTPDNLTIRRRLTEAMQAIPGVQSAATSSYFSVGPASTYRAVPFTVRSAPLTSDETRPLAYMHPVSPGFFATMGTRLLEGRDFAGDDVETAAFNLIVDRTFAERNFPGRSALGEEIAFGAPPYPKDFHWPRIIGVVERVNVVGLEERDGLPFIFVPTGAQGGGGFNVVVRSLRPAADILAAMRAKLHAIDPALPLYNTGTLQETLDLMLLPRRAAVTLLAVFSGLALLLAAVGIYGVLAYDVSQRTKEIGIRGAIGASRGQIIALILRQGMAKTGLGLVIGLGGVLYLTHFLHKLLFDVAGTDPLTYLGVTALLLFVALLASWLPARRAAKVDPVIALRAE